MSMTVGVVGLGLGGVFVQACVESAEVGSVVLCDPQDERLERRKAAGQGKIERTYKDLRRMLESERLDAVCIVTPDHMHRQHAEACLEAGCHVLVTKPMATNLADARAMIEIAERKGRQLMVAQEERYRLVSMRLKEHVEAGDLGEIIRIGYDFISDKRQQFARSPWYASAETGRSALLGSGIHNVDLLRHLVGQPIVRVSAFGNALGSLPFHGDKTTAAIFQFAGGALGEVTVTYEAHARDLQPGADVFQLIGSKGYASHARVICDEWETPRELPQEANPVSGGIKRAVHAFLAALRDGTPVPIPGRDAYDSLAACVAADQSVARGAHIVPERLDF